MHCLHQIAFHAVKQQRLQLIHRMGRSYHSIGKSLHCKQLSTCEGFCNQSLFRGPKLALRRSPAGEDARRITLTSEEEGKPCGWLSKALGSHRVASSPNYRPVCRSLIGASPTRRFVEATFRIRTAGPEPQRAPAASGDPAASELQVHPRPLSAGCSELRLQLEVRKVFYLRSKGSFSARDRRVVCPPETAFLPSPPVLG